MSAYKLPLEVPPKAYGYQFYAFPLAILGTVPGAEEWIFSNYIQLAYDPAEDSPVRLCFYLDDYATNPWLETIRLDQAWLENVHGPDIVAFVRGQVSAGYYPYFNVDEYFVPGRRAFQKVHHSHDLLVHGYDDAQGSVDVLGFDDRGNFVSRPISYSDLIAAWQSHRTMDAPCQQVNCYRIRTDATYPLDLQLVLRTLDEYRTGFNSSTHYAALRTPWSRWYGLGIYAGLQERLTRYLDGEVRYDIRDTHVLWEHKRLMTQRVAYMTRDLSQGHALADAAQRLEADATALRRSLQLHDLDPERPGLPAKVRDLQRMRDDDEAFIENFITALRAM